MITVGRVVPRREHVLLIVVAQCIARRAAQFCKLSDGECVLGARVGKFGGTGVVMAHEKPPYSGKDRSENDLLYFSKVP